MKNDPYVTGVIAAVLPFPMFVFTVLWSWILFFGIGMGLLNYDTVPAWMLGIELLPLMISPAFGIAGIIQGCLRIKQKRAKLGILLSFVGLLENCLLFCGIIYLGRF